MSKITLDDLKFHAERTGCDLSSSAKACYNKTLKELSDSELLILYKRLLNLNDYSQNIRQPRYRRIKLSGNIGGKIIEPSDSEVEVDIYCDKSSLSLSGRSAERHFFMVDPRTRCICLLSGGIVKGNAHSVDDHFKIFVTPALANLGGEGIGQFFDWVESFTPPQSSLSSTKLNPAATQLPVDLTKLKSLLPNTTNGGERESPDVIFSVRKMAAVLEVLVTVFENEHDIPPELISERESLISGAALLFSEFASLNNVEALYFTSKINGCYFVCERNANRAEIFLCEASRAKTFLTQLFKQLKKLNEISPDSHILLRCLPAYPHLREALSRQTDETAAAEPEVSGAAQAYDPSLPKFYDWQSGIEESLKSLPPESRFLSDWVEACVSNDQFDLLKTTLTSSENHDWNLLRAETSKKLLSYLLKKGSFDLFENQWTILHNKLDTAEQRSVADTYRKKDASENKSAYTKWLESLRSTNPNVYSCIMSGTRVESTPIPSPQIETASQGAARPSQKTSKRKNSSGRRQKNKSPSNPSEDERSSKNLTLYQSNKLRNFENNFLQVYQLLNHCLNLDIEIDRQSSQSVLSSNPSELSERQPQSPRGEQSLQSRRLEANSRLETASRRLVNSYQEVASLLSQDEVSGLLTKTASYFHGLFPVANISALSVAWIKGNSSSRKSQLFSSFLSWAHEYHVDALPAACDCIGYVFANLIGGASEESEKMRIFFRFPWHELSDLFFDTSRISSEELRKRLPELSIAQLLPSVIFTIGRASSSDEANDYGLRLEGFIHLLSRMKYFHDFSTTDDPQLMRYFLSSSVDDRFLDIDIIHMCIASAFAFPHNKEAMLRITERLLSINPDVNGRLKTTSNTQLSYYDFALFMKSILSPGKKRKPLEKKETDIQAVDARWKLYEQILQDFSVVFRKFGTIRKLPHGTFYQIAPPTTAGTAETKDSHLSDNLSIKQILDDFFNIEFDPNEFCDYSRVTKLMMCVLMMLDCPADHCFYYNQFVIDILNIRTVQLEIKTIKDYQIRIGEERQSASEIAENSSAASVPEQEDTDIASELTLLKSGSTILHLAAQFGLYDVVNTLLQAGANYSSRNENGDTAVQVAKKVLDILQKNPRFISPERAQTIDNLKKVIDIVRVHVARQLAEKRGSYKASKSTVFSVRETASASTGAAAAAPARNSPR